MQGRLHMLQGLDQAFQGCTCRIAEVHPLLYKLLVTQIVLRLPTRPVVELDAPGPSAWVLL